MRTASFRYGEAKAALSRALKHSDWCHSDEDVSIVSLGIYVFFLNVLFKPWRILHILSLFWF